MKKINLILIITCFFIACGGRTSKIEKLVPEDAVFFIQAENPDGVFEEADAFLDSAQLSMFSGGKSSKMIFSEIVAGSGINLEQVNTAHPVGMALIIKGGFSPEPQFVMLIPLAENDISSIENAVKPMGFIVKNVENYAVITGTEEIADKYPLEKHLDLSSLSKYEEKSITAYIGMKTIMLKFGPMISGGLGMAKGMLSPQMYGSEMDPAMAGMVGKLIDFYFALLEKIIDIAKKLDNLTYSVAANAEGVEISSTTEVARDNYVSDFVNASGTDGDIKEYAKYLPDDYMFTMLGNINPEVLKMIGIGMIDMLSDASIVDQADVTGLKKISSDLYDAMGYKTAAAFDMNFNMELFTGMSDMSTIQDPADISSILGEALKINLIAVYELKDTELFRSAMKEMINGGIISGIVNNLYRDLGIKFNISLREKVVENGFEYDIVNYDMDLSGLLEVMAEDSLESKFQMQMISAMLDALMDNFNLYIHYTDNQCFMTMGREDGPGYLKSLVDNNSYIDGSIAESEAFINVLKDVKPDNNYFFQISVVDLVDLIISAASRGAVNSLNITDTTGLVSYGKFADNKMEGKVLYSSKEIAGFVSNMGVFMSLGNM